MKSWQDNRLRKGDTVFDNGGERGRGVIIRMWPFGADIEFERDGQSFLGFHWIDKIVSPAERAAYPTTETTFNLPDIDDTPAV